MPFIQYYYYLLFLKLVILSQASKLLCIKVHKEHSLMLYNLAEPLSKQDMQEGYVLFGMHGIKNAASPYISLNLFLYKKH